jgi:hypothetical protein
LFFFFLKKNNKKKKQNKRKRKEKEKEKLRKKYYKILSFVNKKKSESGLENVLLPQIDNGKLVFDSCLFSSLFSLCPLLPSSSVSREEREREKERKQRAEKKNVRVG